MDSEFQTSGLWHVYYVCTLFQSFSSDVTNLLVFGYCKIIYIERAIKKQFIIIVEMKVFTICSKAESDSKCICLWNEQQELSVHSELLFRRAKSKL